MSKHRVMIVVQDPELDYPGKVDPTNLPEGVERCIQLGEYDPKSADDLATMLMVLSDQVERGIRT